MSADDPSPRYFSPCQIAVAAFIGTALAAAFLTALNVAERRSRWHGAVFFVGFLVVYLVLIGLNPFSSRAVDYMIFLTFTVGLLLGNHLMGHSASVGPARSWVFVVLSSLAFLAAWLALILVVFN